MSRVEDAIRKAHEAGRGAFVGYLPIGYPDLQTSIDAALTLANNGVDVIELDGSYAGWARATNREPATTA